MRKIYFNMHLAILTPSGESNKDKSNNDVVNKAV